MAAFTLAQMLAANVQSAAFDLPGMPGFFVAEWEMDGGKKTIAQNDTIQFLEIPAYTGVLVLGAGVEILRVSTASADLDLGIATTDITGLTDWNLDDAVGTKLVKLATAANSVIATSSATQLTAQVKSAALGVGRFRVRVFGYFLAM